jgi:hypothetical protein
VIRSLVIGLSILAVINLLLIAGGIAWLHTTDRLDVARLQEAHQLFRETLTARAAREAEADAAAEAARVDAALREKESQPPIPSADLLAVRLENTQADLARLEAIRREAQILQETLRRERRALEEEKLAFSRERDNFERARRIVVETEGSAQFKKALATYEGLKPDRARIAFDQLIQLGQTDQVVAYLNAMQERARTRIIDEFLRDQPAVATDLLERLRVRGLAARTP